MKESKRIEKNTSFGSLSIHRCVSLGWVPVLTPPPLLNPAQSCFLPSLVGTSLRKAILGPQSWWTTFSSPPFETWFPAAFHTVDPLLFFFSDNPLLPQVLHPQTGFPLDIPFPGSHMVFCVSLNAAQLPFPSTSCPPLESLAQESHNIHLNT